MNRKLGRILRTNAALYIVCLLIFVALAFVVDVRLGIAEAVVAVVVFLISHQSGKRTQQSVRQFVDRIAGGMDSARSTNMLYAPLPMAVFHALTGEVVWSNDGFLQLTDRKDMLFESHMEDVVPGFQRNWLMEGKRECPELVSWNHRLYRVFGALSRPEEIARGDEMLAIIEKQKQEDISSVLGEEGTQEAFFEYLRGIYLSPEMYDRAVTQNVLYQECFNSLYGQNAEKVSKETALNYLNENGYVSAAHILFLFNDPESGEVRDEETLAANKTRLESLVKELRGYPDQRARAKAFLQKAADLSEDSGKAYYPEGYTYTSGTMVPQFEDAVNSLAEYEISDVVETDYGYHVIMRLPLSADAVVELNNSTGEPRTARMLSANKDYGERLQNLSDSLPMEWLPGCEAPVLTDYIH